MRGIYRLALLSMGTAVASAMACSSGPAGSGFDVGVDAGTAWRDSSDGDGGTLATDLDSNVPGFGGGDGAVSHGGSCAVTDPSADMDKDGWSPTQGDCNDCDPNVNPGAVDVLNTNDGGTPTWGDEDCDGKPGDSALPCDTGLALASVDPNDGAKALDLCTHATDTDRRYGVLSATYMRADGTPFASGNPGLQVGIEPGYGANVHVQAGANLLLLSTGHARVVGDTGACNGISCQTNATGTPPTGFPQDDPACPKTTKIADDVALELKIRVPTNATGYAFNLKFYSFEFPDWVCDAKGYNDQFIALVTPPPMGSYVPAGSMGGNISFDSNQHPVSVNLGFFDVCDPATPARFASHCKSGAGPCPAVPSPYCPLGVPELSGTGFDTWHATVGPSGGTRWLQTQAPAKPGSTITIRFAIWDAGNAQYDSTVLLDNFHWIANGAVAVMTQPPPVVK